MFNPLSRTLIRGLLAVGLCAFNLPVAQADLLAIYDFEADAGNVAGTETVALEAVPHNVLSGVTASNISAGPGIVGSTTSSVWTVFSVNGVPANGILVRSSATNSSLANAVTDNDSLTFTLQPSTGTMSLSSVSFDYANSYNNSAIFTNNVVLRSSLTGTTNLLSDSITNSTLLTTIWEAVSVDLTSIAALQNFSTPVTFQIYIYDDGSQNGNVTRFDNITINGTVAVPEPSAWCLGLLAAIGAVSIGRRKRGQR